MNNSPQQRQSQIPPQSFSNFSYEPEVSRWKKFVTYLVGLLAIFFGLMPRSTYCDVSVIKTVCFSHITNMIIFAVLFIVLISLSKFFLNKRFELKSMWYITVVGLFVLSLILNLAVNKYKEESGQLSI